MIAFKTMKVNFKSLKHAVFEKFFFLVVQSFRLKKACRHEN